MTVDDVLVSAARLTDREVEVLRGAYTGMADDPKHSGPVRDWYAQLAGSLGLVQRLRFWQWAAILSDPAVPPSWAVAVAALPPEVPPRDFG